MKSYTKKPFILCIRGASDSMKTDQSCGSVALLIDFGVVCFTASWLNNVWKK